MTASEREAPAPAPSRAPLAVLGLLACALAAAAFAWLWLEERRAAHENRERLATSESEAGADERAQVLEDAQAKLRTELAETRTRLAESQKAKPAAEPDAERRLEEQRRSLKDRAAKERAGLEEQRTALQAELTREAGKRRAVEDDLRRAGERIAELEAERARDAAPRAEPPPPSAPGDLASALRAEVASALAECRDESELAARLGTGAHLLPLLAERFAESGPGLLAIQHCAALRGVDPAALLEALAKANRSDESFVAAAARAVRIAVPDSRLGAMLKSLRERPSPALRLIAFEAGAHLADAMGVAAAALADPEPAIALAAAKRLAGGGDDARRALVDALAAGKLSAEQEELAIPAALAGDPAGWPRLLARARTDPAFASTLFAQTVAPPRDREWIAELLAATSAELDLRPQVARALGQLAATPLADLVRVALSEPGAEARFAAAALRKDTGDPVRDRAAALLHGSSFVLESADAVFELASLARPAHLPYLYASLDLVPFPRRAAIAAVLAKLGHPEGAAVLRRGADRMETESVVASLDAMAQAGVAPDDEQRARLFADPRPEVRSALIVALASREEAIAPAEALPVLAGAEGADATRILDSLRKHADAASIRNQLLAELESGERFADPDALAAWIFGPGWPPSVDLARHALAHANPVVRARAAEDLYREAADPSPALRELEASVRDPDARVRVHAARALGRIRNDLARTALVLLCGDPEPLVRESALLSLGKQEPYHLLPVLRKATRDADPWVRNAARLALLARNVDDDLPALLEDFGDPVIGPRTRTALEREMKMEGKSRTELEAAVRRRAESRPR